MEWVFEGIGTLIVGMLIGAGGTSLYYRRSKRQTQRQRGGSGSTQFQAGRDISLNETPDEP